MIQNFFLNSPIQPEWAKRMERMIMQAAEKLAELEAAMGGIGASLEGISGDLQTLNANATAQAAEVASLKQAVLDAQGGNLSAADLARFDALIQSVKDAAQKAADLDAQLPNIPVATPAPQPAPAAEPTPAPAPEPAPVAEAPAAPAAGA